MSPISGFQHDDLFFFLFIMLRIGRKDEDVQIKETLDAGYTDITSVCMWLGAVEKYGVEQAEAATQIELFVQSLGADIDPYNRTWYETYKQDGFN